MLRVDQCPVSDISKDLAPLISICSLMCVYDIFDHYHGNIHTCEHVILCTHTYMRVYTFYIHMYKSLE